MNILVIGDGCLDLTRFCAFQRWSPEDSRCPVLWEDRQDISLGGAANVARWLAADARLKVTLATPHGREPASDLFRLLCKESGISLYSRLSSAAFAMTVKERIVVEDAEMRTLRQGARIDTDNLGMLSPVDMDGLERTLQSEHWDALVCVDYDKRVFRGPMGASLMDVIGRFQGEVFVNTKCLGRWRNVPVSVLACNEKELAASLAIPPRSAWEVLHAHCLVVTRGAQGVTAVLPGTDLTDATRATEVVDVCGAGDAFLAGLVRAATRDRQWHVPNHLVDVLDYGQKCAAWCVGQVGCGTPLVEGE